MSLPETDRYDIRLARGASGVLREFNQAGVLTAADVHVATRLGLLGDTSDDAVLLGAAFAVRAPRLGHVCVDLATIRTTATSDLEEADLRELPWPDEDDWIARCCRRPALRPRSAAPPGGDDALPRPLLVRGTAGGPRSPDPRGAPADGVDIELLATGLARLFTSEEQPDLQRLAAASAVLRRFSVIAGGPGTGKTTTVARVLVLLDEQAAAREQRPSLVALSAPTGKAAARLQEAVHQEAAALPVDSEERTRLLQLRGVTLHRLLGFNPANRSRFRHNRLNRLAHDVIVVDETSMVSLSMMARLVEAVRTDARLILVGDPEQLASVEAGAVLGDIVGPASRGLLMRPAARRVLAQASGQKVPALRARRAAGGGPSTGGEPAAGGGPGATAWPASPIGDGVVVLRHVHRFGGNIARLAEAIQAGDGKRALGLLKEGRGAALGGGGVPGGAAGAVPGAGGVEWIPVDVAGEGAVNQLESVRAAAVGNGRHPHRCRPGRSRPEGDQRAGRIPAPLRSPTGTRWREHLDGRGRALARLRDRGVRGGGRLVRRPATARHGERLQPPSLQRGHGRSGRSRSGPGRGCLRTRWRDPGSQPDATRSVDTVYAMTVHKAQGSQFDAVAVLLPGPDSPILTRELLYTAVTRARRRLFLVGTEESVVAAIDRPIARASGLRPALWGTPPPVPPLPDFSETRSSDSPDSSGEAAG